MKAEPLARRPAISRSSKALPSQACASSCRQRASSRTFASFGSSVSKRRVSKDALLRTPRFRRSLRAGGERPRCRAPKRGNEFSPPDVNCHLTLPWGHATEGTLSYPAVLRRGISNRPTSARGPSRTLSARPRARPMAAAPRKRRKFMMVPPASQGARSRISRISSREEMRPGRILIFFCAPSGNKMVISDCNVLKTRLVRVDLKHCIAGGWAAGFGNMRGRRRVLVSRLANTSWIDDYFVASGCHSSDMTVAAQHEASRDRPYTFGYLRPPR